MAFNKKSDKSAEEIYREERKNRIKKASKSNRKPLSSKAKKAIAIACAVVIVAGAGTAYVATGAIRGGLLSYTQLPQKTLSAYTITLDDTKIKVTPAQYNYYFATAYNNIYSMVNLYEQLGMDAKELGYDVDLSKPLEKQVKEEKDGKKITWADYLAEETQKTIKKTEVLYAEAVKANDNKEPELTEEEQKNIDDTIASYKESADKYGYTLDGYLNKAIGRGVNEKLVREEMKKSAIASKYEEDYSKNNESTKVTDDDIQKYYEENKTKFSSIDVFAFETKDEATAKKMAEELKADKNATFSSMASKYSETKYEKDAYSKDERNLTVGLMKATAETKYELENDDFNWLYSADRKAGDIAALGRYVFQIEKPIYQSEQSTVTVRHILLQPDLEDDQTASDVTDKEWSQLYDQAVALRNEWVKNGKTEEAFSEIAKKNTTDEASKTTGGLISGVYPGQTVGEFNAWCFDSKRKTGDVDIVRTDYGYHLIYFVKNDGVPYWKTVAKSELTENASTVAIDKLVEKYTLKENWFATRFFNDDTSLGY